MEIECLMSAIFYGVLFALSLPQSRSRTQVPRLACENKSCRSDLPRLQMLRRPRIIEEMIVVVKPNQIKDYFLFWAGGRRVKSR